MNEQLMAKIRRLAGSDALRGAVLLLGAVIALVLASSPIAEQVDAFWRLEIGVVIDESLGALTLHGVVNELLMALFFLVVGLEVKHELVRGELSSRRKAALPAFAAIGGVVVPAAIYLGIVGAAGSSEHLRGWGIVIATDIAFAVGVLGLFGKLVPRKLGILLLAIATVDDIIAVLVIAVFYTGQIQPLALVLALAGSTGLIVMGVTGVRRVGLYLLAGAVLWVLVYASGVHATLAGVVVGLAVPAKGEDPPVERLHHHVEPWVTFVVLPVFALANANVPLSGELLAATFTHPVGIAIMAGLIVGKEIGIIGASWLSQRAGVGRLPGALRWRHAYIAAAVAGIGFTMSLYISELAFESSDVAEVAKVAILIASLVSGVEAAAVLGISALVRRRRGESQA